MPADDGAPGSRAITLATIDPFPPVRVESLMASVSRYFAAPCRLRHLPLVDAAPLLPGRDQIDSDSLLERIESLAHETGEIVVGVTERDLGTRIFTFVFGRARREGHVALVSLARLGPEYYGLPPDPDLEMRRAVAEIAHEIGHVAGLDHCDDTGCVMRFATNVESIDLRGGSFCAACSQRLPDGLVRRAAPRARTLPDAAG